MPNDEGGRRGPWDGFARRGVAYDTGSNFETGQGELSRTVWSTAAMEHDISAIAGDLRCDSVTVYGTDLGRLASTAHAAASHGLHVWLQPRLVDRPQREVLDHLAEAARLAEGLRRQGVAIDLTVGGEHSVFTPGIVPGEQYHERMANIFAEADHFLLRPTVAVDVAATAPALNAYLAKASQVAHGIFGGGVGYSALPSEDVDWRLFDFVGLMYQYLPRPLSRAGHLELLAGYAHWGKPLVIAEFGTATYRGAEEKAFFFWDVVDRQGDELVVLDGYERDEHAQAAYHRKMFGIFAEAGVHSVAVGEFIHPTHPHSPEPRLDLDTASMAIVKTIRADFADPASAYHWEPKESFRAIAEYYEADRARAAGRRAA
ncbi:abortive phage infection protein [Amycolatopsis sp. NPDC098790]|uniref:abortive phage infection protein n=1 Tax=Amycolatopsis sp. NPDC098790 TaxID=3363939 RepID=UPI0038214887